MLKIEEEVRIKTKEAAETKKKEAAALKAEELAKATAAARGKDKDGVSVGKLALYLTGAALVVALGFKYLSRK